MNMNKYTEKAAEAISSAVELATEHHQAQVEPEHLMLALVQQSDGIVPQLMSKLGLRAEQVVRERRGRGPEAAEGLRHQRAADAQPAAGPGAHRRRG